MAAYGDLVTKFVENMGKTKKQLGQTQVAQEAHMEAFKAGIKDNVHELASVVGAVSPYTVVTREFKKTGDQTQVEILLLSQDALELIERHKAVEKEIEELLPASGESNPASPTRGEILRKERGHLLRIINEKTLSCATLRYMDDGVFYVDVGEYKDVGESGRTVGRVEAADAMDKVFKGFIGTIEQKLPIEVSSAYKKVTNEVAATIA